MGVSRLLRILGACALALGLMLIGGPAFATPGYGSDDEPTVSLSASATNGEITARGAGFEPGETVTGTVYSSAKSIGTQTADSNGRVTFTFSVRDLDLKPGKHRLVLSAPSGSATAWFTVLGEHGGDDVTVVDASDSSDDSSSDGSSSDDSSSGGSSSDDSAEGSSSLDGSSSGGLAFTGSNVIVPLSVVGAMLLVGGVVAVAGSSRRKRDKTQV